MGLWNYRHNYHHVSTCSSGSKIANSNTNHDIQSPDNDMNFTLEWINQEINTHYYSFKDFFLNYVRQISSEIELRTAQFVFAIPSLKSIG